MTTLVVLSVVDIVLLIAGLAFYLYVVGGQLTRVATDLEECADIVWDIKANAEPIVEGVDQHQPHRRCRRRRAAAALRHGRGDRRGRDLPAAARAGPRPRRRRARRRSPDCTTWSATTALSRPRVTGRVLSGRSAEGSAVVGAS